MASFRIAYLLGLCALPALVGAGIIDDLEGLFGRAVDCASCHAMLPTLKTLAYIGDDYFIDTIVKICKDMKIEDDDVCEGAIRDQGPILAHDLRSISLIGPTSTKLCDAIFGLCQPPPVVEFEVPFPKPAPEHQQTWVSTGKKPIQVLHFSDVHIDREYVMGSEANCTKPICCRVWDSESISTPATSPAGPNGHRRCDTPVSLLDSALEAARTIGKDAKFAIFTGDVIEHVVWDLNETRVTSDMRAFNQDIIQKLHVPMYPSLGNHESAPVNSYPRNTTETEIDAEWVFATQSEGWNQWIGDEAAGQVTTHYGSYAAVVPGLKLRIISVNTQYWYKQNFWLYDSDVHQPDPNGVIAFIVEQLQAAEDAGERAWIIGHAPTGRGDIISDQSNYFDQVLQRYKNTIAGQFFGHTHRHEFAIGYSDYENQVAENAVSIAMIGAALTPNSGNPAFTVYDVDPDTYELMDVRVYIANLTAPSFQVQPQWLLYYSARETYTPLVPLPSSSALTPAWWHNLTEVFEANETAFNEYNSRRTRSAPKMGQCVGRCKDGTICDMRTMRTEYNCDDPWGPARRMLPSDVGDNADVYVPHHRAGDSCEGHGLSHILREVVARFIKQATSLLLEDTSKNAGTPDVGQAVFSLH